MKHFLRETGTALMALSGIAFAAVLFRMVTFFRGGEHTPAESLTFFLLLPAVCAGLFLLGRRLKSAAGGKGAKQENRTGSAERLTVRQRAKQTEARESVPPKPCDPGPETGPAAGAASLHSDPETHDIYGLPEEVELVECPFAGRLETIGPDGLKDESPVALWLRPRAGAEAAGVISALAEWMSGSEKRAEELKKEHWLQYWSITGYGRYLYALLTEDRRWLDGVSDDVLELCRRKGGKTICVAQLTGTGMRDLVNGTEYTLVYQEWPGSADDAATYGEWGLTESKPSGTAFPASDAGDRSEKQA